uniref:Enoyl-[acyl-carrier-protein] reductase, mitochondrial n=1 Tax=Aceria tosichella TaxID=561515 RepID=A0A6G1S3F5_9ACAR
MHKLLRPALMSCRRLLSTQVKELPDHRALVIEKFGEPVDSVILQTKKPHEVLPKKLESDQILVEHLASCINPADINLIQGVYGVKPPLPAVVGGEGVTRVLAVGANVKHLSPGDMAFGISTLGYWQSYSVQEGGTFHKVDKDLDVTTAAQLRVNPCTAYRMMKDFCKLQRGDTMVQNGANSAVGVYAIQLAKHWGVRTINVIRDKPNKSEIVDELKGYGADFVVTEEELRDTEIMTPILKQMGKPKLFLNCVSGKNATSCHRILDYGAYSVTYGFMSKQPLMLGAQTMFRDQQIRFFWVSQWYKEREQSRRDEISNMLNEVADMFKSGILKPKRSTLISFEDRNIAFSGSNNTKYIFSINK